VKGVNAFASSVPMIPVAPKMVCINLISGD
jgi:hypothetical protein